MSKGITKTCISLTDENMTALDIWSRETGLSKSAIINHLVENAYKTGTSISVTYDLKARGEKTNE